LRRKVNSFAGISEGGRWSANPFNNKALQKIQVELFVKGVSKYHGGRCEWCVNFVGCKKNPAKDTNYCLFSDNRYESKFLLKNSRKNGNYRN
jgi:hypothetical protein